MKRNIKAWLKRALPRFSPWAGRAWRSVVRWARAPHDGTTVPRWARLLLVLSAVLVCAVAFGVSTAQTQANFGPHDAHYEITTDAVLTIDVGPLGTVQLESGLPLGLGVRATIEEIPVGLSNLGPSQTLGALGQDVEQYLQFFAAPNHTIDLVTKLLVQDAVHRTLLATVGILAALGLIAVLLGPSRRKELAYPLARNTWGLTAGFVVLCLVVTPLVTHRASLTPVGTATSAVFANTPLQGARITGRLSDVIDAYGSQLLAVYEENELFYAQATNALEEAFDIRQFLTSQAQELVERNGAQQTIAAPAPPADPGPSPSVGLPQELMTSPPTPEPEPGLEPDPVTLLVISDLHCNVGMAPLITVAAQRSGAQIILNAGDTTITGTELERFCVESFVGAAPKGVDFVQADGNHDSEATSQQAANAGAIVLGGEVVEVRGLRILGDSDPNATRIGQGSVSVRGENYESAGQRLSDVACAARDVDLLLVHTPKVGDVPLNEGCVTYQVSGHVHRRGGPEFYGQGIRYMNSTTAGAVANKVTIGPLNGTAEMTVLTYDRANKVMLSLQNISVTPRATAVVGPVTRYPRPGDKELPATVNPPLLPPTQQQPYPEMGTPTSQDMVQ